MYVVSLHPRPLSLTLLLALSAGCSVSGPGLLGGQKPSDADSTVSAKTDKGDSDCNTRPDADAFADQLLRLINIERFEIGAVEIDPKLNAVAGRFACAMIDQGFFGHTNPHNGDGVVERITAAGYEYLTIGENLAAGISNAPATIDAWLNSEAHRDVLLDPVFTKAGIAVRYGGEYGVYCVLLLAEPAE